MPPHKKRPLSLPLNPFTDHPESEMVQSGTPRTEHAAVVKQSPAPSPPRPARPSHSPFDPQEQQEILAPRRPTAKPQADESFWRWSHATSATPSAISSPAPTIDTYAPTELQFPASHLPMMDSEGNIDSASVRTTFYSDFSAPSTVPDVPDMATLPGLFKRGQGLSSIPEASVSVVSTRTREKTQKDGRVDSPEKRMSVGTFGRYNSLYSSTHTSPDAPPRQTPTSSPPRADNPFTPPRRRPLSFSSSPSSTNNSPTKGKDHTTTESALEKLGAGYKLGMRTPSDRADHREEESERGIEAYLWRQSRVNERRIAPSPLPPSPPYPAGPAGLEPALEIDQDKALVARDREREGKQNQDRKNGFRRSKVDQMLGEGAEYARYNMGLDRKVLEDTIEQRNGPLPPMRHKPSASLPVNSPPRLSPLPPLPLPTRDQSTTTIQALLSPLEKTHSPPPRGAGFHGRSVSIDSLPSLHPSLSDSVVAMNTLDGEKRPLLKRSLPPTASETSLRLVKPAFTPRPSNISLIGSTSTTLTPSQRTLLVKRTRKLEHLLGQPLPEAQIEQSLIEPLNGVREYDVQVGEAWPESPSPGSSATARAAQDDERGRRVPEWEREDCLVRRVPAGLGGGSLPSLHGEDDLAKPVKMSLAQKALAAFNLPAPQKSDELKVYVSRQMRVTETVSRGTSSSVGVNREQVPPTSPMSPMSANTTSSWESQLREESGESEAVKKGRRVQLAKLHRLLGVPIPPELVSHTRAPTPTPAPDPGDKSRSSISSTSSRQTDSPPLEGLSFLSLDDSPNHTSGGGGRGKGNKWNKLKGLHRKMASRSGSPSPLPSSSLVGMGEMGMEGGDDGASFMDLGEGKKKMSKEEKMVFRKRAAKLEQVLGDKPPSSSIYIPSTLRSTPDIPEERLSSFESYSASLQGLLYLVDHDETKLAQVIARASAPGVCRFWAYLACNRVAHEREERKEQKEREGEMEGREE
ncbi:hypothetical protein L198_06116 [Cryptococcus wingfieldii CBS 7118]|uniref:Uncharacterized protein n=1 Tax=Cryptococcus wingfieldii CBS 7118 TaxID=1295528 RepID=A0A1E3IQC9_9TREE|nr:hypothetical protein L198_06116 [Cryptococcus wingfieldii CBS 7118]ODN90799.1 hypothetical protein L198_06116 [Cryptococcus wingfieldii CBS 7118]